MDFPSCLLKLLSQLYHEVAKYNEVWLLICSILKLDWLLSTLANCKKVLFWTTSTSLHLELYIENKINYLLILLSRNKFKCLCIVVEYRATWETQHASQVVHNLSNEVWRKFTTYLYFIVHKNYLLTYLWGFSLLVIIIKFPLLKLRGIGHNFDVWRTKLQT